MEEVREEVVMKVAFEVLVVNATSVNRMTTLQEIVQKMGQAEVGLHTWRWGWRWRQWCRIKKLLPVWSRRVLARKCPNKEDNGGGGGRGFFHWRTKFWRYTLEVEAGRTKGAVVGIKCGHNTISLAIGLRSTGGLLSLHPAIFSSHTRGAAICEILTFC